MAERLDAAAVVLDVVRGPADPELVASGGQLTDQVGELAVVGVAAGFGAQAADGGVGDAVPVAIELGRGGVEEDESGEVDRAVRVDERRGVQRVAELVGGQDVQPPVAHERGSADHRVKETLHTGPHPLLGWPATRRTGGICCTHEVGQVRAFDIIELQRAGDALQHLLRDTAASPRSSRV